MAKNFDDFMKLANDHELIRDGLESLLPEIKRAMDNAESVTELDALKIQFIEDLMLLYLRAYHEWLHS